jgi:hypothetical protein
MNKSGVVVLIFALIFISETFITCNVEACKDIIACGDATEGDFNLLLKVRDPSRPGLQVLCIVPEGYEYTYHYPWTGKSLESQVLKKYIGVATQDDVIPNIVKAGMSLSNAGISYSDADSGSRWINPTKNAWDDFDWMRYTCEKAENEDEAVSLLIEDVVKKMHATGVSENLFVVGPDKGIIIEADAIHFKIDEFTDGMRVMSNYPKELWKTQRLKKWPIAQTFDTVVEKTVRKGQAIRLKSIQGIRVTDVSENSVSVKLIPFSNALKTKNFVEIFEIKIGQRNTIGPFSVRLIDIEGNKAKISMRYIYKDWEEILLKIIQPYYGSLTIENMINFSRLHGEDLEGLRPMCEDYFQYEAVAIYKIPKENYETMSMGWFSPNHACSSIYVPFHICNTDIYDSYETGEAAELSLNLLNVYGHDTLSKTFSKTEEVFLNEIAIACEITAKKNYFPEIVSNFLTVIDMGMQKQAYLTEEIWIEISKISDDKTKQLTIDIVDEIWIDDYLSSMNMMEESIGKLMDLPKTDSIVAKLSDIALDISKSRINAAKAIGTNTQSAEKRYETGHSLIKEENFEKGLNQIKKAFVEVDNLIKGQKHTEIIDEQNEKVEKIDTLIYFLYILLIFLVLLIIFRKKIV